MCARKSNGWTDRRINVFFSLGELKRLAASPDSCVSCVNCKRSIGLLPMHFKNLNSSIKELLNAKVPKYDVELQGVILAHKNVKLIAQSIQLGDSRSCPLEYVADIYIFKPAVGSTLSGVVNKLPKNYEYLSVLVHNIFNVTVHTSVSHPLPKSAIKIGTTVSVVVTYIDFTGRLPYIKGTLSHANYEENEDEIDEVAEDQIKSNDSHIKKKDLNSILRNSPLRTGTTSWDLGSQDPNIIESDVNKSDDNSNSKKKKKKKKKMEENTSSSKRKREDDDSTLRKKKKKRKSKDLEKVDEIDTISPELLIPPSDYKSPKGLKIEPNLSNEIGQVKRQLEFSGSEKRKVLKLKKESGEDSAIGESSSSQTEVSSVSKKKKKKKKSVDQEDDVTSLLLKEALKNIKEEL